MSERKALPRRQDDPPPRTGPRIDVKRVVGGQSTTICILSSRIQGFIVHWDVAAGRKGRSGPCLQDESACQGCKTGLAKKWLGYLCVISSMWGRCFIELTPEAARQITDQAGGNGDLRGVRGRLYRTSANNGRLRFEVSEFRESSEKLPKDEDVSPVLEWLWNWQRKAS